MEDVISFKKKIRSYVNRALEGNVCLMNFLDEGEISLLKEETKFEPLNIEFYGKIENSERKRCILSFYDIKKEDYKIALYKINYNKKFYEINHRSILGSLMSLGIKRECIGDIVIKENKDAFFVCTEEISKHIENEFKRVGNAFINIERIEDELKNEIKYETKIHFLSSLRLDVFISACASISRSETLEILKAENVFLNQILNQNPSHQIKEGDEISIRHFGKFKVLKVGGTSKSGRIIVESGKRI